MSSAPTHILFECATGCAIFEVIMVEEIGSLTQQVQNSVAQLSTFQKMVKLLSFSPFKNALDALQASLDISEGVLNEYLKSLLTLNLKSSKKSSKVLLGVADRNLASSIVGELSIPCDTGESSIELIRAVRQHAEKLLKGMAHGDLAKAQLGLGHSYSRSKVKFNVNRSDNMIIQAIALLDTLDKDVNTFSMRVREWYGWHFPELVKLAPDNMTYAKLAQYIRNKQHLTEDKLDGLTDLVNGDQTAAKNILDASRASMGTEIGEMDMINIQNFAERVINLGQYRKNMSEYLREKMSLVAPNLAALVGDIIAARLISHAGSLTNLAKYPASTVQILGAEKALFRALKTKGNTPKYGLIYHASAIARAAPKNKGRMSRFLANKISIASRIDCFTDTPTTKFGEVLAAQVEERLAFYETGKPPSKNTDAMAKAIKAMEEEAGDLMDVDAQNDDEQDDAADASEASATIPATASQKVSKKDKKKDKKEKSKSGDKHKKDEVEKAAKKAAKKARKSEANAAPNASSEPENDSPSKKGKKDKKKSKA